MTKMTRIFVAGHRGLVGSAIVRRLEAEGHRTCCWLAERRWICAIESAVDELLRAGAAGVCVPGGRESGRDSGQQHPPGGISARQSGHPDQRDPRGLEARRAQAAVSGLLLHLPEIRAAADSRGISADR